MQIGKGCHNVQKPFVQLHWKVISAQTPIPDCCLGPESHHAWPCVPDPGPRLQQHCCIAWENMTVQRLFTERWCPMHFMLELDPKQQFRTVFSDPKSMMKYQWTCFSMATPAISQGHPAPETRRSVETHMACRWKWIRGFLATQRWFSGLSSWAKLVETTTWQPVPHNASLPNKQHAEITIWDSQDCKSKAERFGCTHLSLTCTGIRQPVLSWAFQSKKWLACLFLIASGHVSLILVRNCSSTAALPERTWQCKDYSPKDGVPCTSCWNLIQDNNSELFFWPKVYDEIPVNLFLNGYTSYLAGSPRSGNTPLRGDTYGVPMKMNSGVPGDSEIVFLANHSVRPKAKLVETTTWQHLATIVPKRKASKPHKDHELRRTFKEIWGFGHWTKLSVNLNRWWWSPNHRAAYPQ